MHLRWVLRFLTDSNLGGVEKLTVCLPAGNMCQGRTTLKPGDVVTTALDTADVSQYVPPMGLFLVKGWTRSLACMCVLACAWENPAFFEACSSLFARVFPIAQVLFRWEYVISSIVTIVVSVACSQLPGCRPCQLT